MVMDGRPWTNECCMCVRSTHAEVGRSGRVGRPKADFGPDGGRPRGGFGWIWGVVDGQSRAQKLAQQAERRGRLVISGGTNRSGWGHIRAELGAQPAGGWWVRWVSGVCETSAGAQKSAQDQIQALFMTEIPRGGAGALAAVPFARCGVLCRVRCSPIVGAHAVDLGAYKCAPTF